MDNQEFESLEETLRSQGPSAGFDLLAARAKEQKNYRLLFATRLMETRFAFGLPLLENTAIPDVPADRRTDYERRFMDAARETGSLFLADGDIASAWPYFKAIGEPGPVAAAIDAFQEGDDLDRVIEVAFHHGANPRRGFELLLQHHGACRAITMFGQYPDPQTRQQCLALLIQTLYGELFNSLSAAIASVEGTAPENANVDQLIAGRGWLFEGNSYYIDTSHLASVLRYAPELESPDMLRLAAQMADYGQRLAPMFHFKGDAPFEDTYSDYSLYLHALLDEDVERAITHFRGKVTASMAEYSDPSPAGALIGLLIRLKRYTEAIAVSREYLRDTDSSQFGIPTAIELCQMAGDFELLRDVAREKGDLLAFAAGVIST